MAARFFGASLWRFPSRLHARGEHSGAAMQRSMPSLLHFRTGGRIPPPPDFARMQLRASFVLASQTSPLPSARAILTSREVCHAEAASEASVQRRRTPILRAISQGPMTAPPGVGRSSSYDSEDIRL